MGTPGACKASSSGSAIPSLPPRSGRSCTTPGTGPAPRHAVPTWKQSWTAQAPRGILAAGFVHMDTVLLRRVYALIVIGHGTRRAYLAGITANPDGAWTTQAARNFLMEPGPRMTGVKFLITDRAGQFTAGFDAVFLAGGITNCGQPTAGTQSERHLRTGHRDPAARSPRPTAHRQRVPPAPGSDRVPGALQHRRPYRALGQLPPAHAHSRPPKISLAEHRIRRRQVLGALTTEYEVAA